MVPEAGPGVFTAKPAGPGAYELVVSGRAFTSREEIERYLAYRAARWTVDKGGQWFTLRESRGPGETAAPAPSRDPTGARYSFRMKYFRPVWRYKGPGAWVRWSPFAGTPFPAAEAKAGGEFAVSATIVVHTGPMDDADPLAFEAWALSDLLVNQVSPPH
jgi:hypothetical protein